MEPLKANGSDRLQAFSSHMKALNSQFFSWVKEQAEKCPGEDWSDGVQDYLDHRRSLVAEFSDCLEAAKPTASTPAASAPAAAPSHSVFSFVSKPASNSTSLFGSAPTAPVPKFGADAPPPSFGAPSTTFGAPTGAMFGAGPATTATDGAAEGDDEEGPSEADQANYKPEVQADEAAGTILFKAKGKALVLKDKTWEKKAVGTLTIRKPASGRPFAMVGTDAGRSLLTVTIPSKAKLVVNDSSNKVHGISFSGVYTLPDGAEKAQQGSIMFQVTAEKGPDLRAQLEKIVSS